MEFEDDGLDDDTRAPLLPQDDRLWRHPSEVAAAPGARAVGAPPKTPDGRPPRLVTVVALTSCISVLLTLGLVAVVRPFRTRVQIDSFAAPAVRNASLNNIADVAHLAEKLGPAITRVVAKHEKGELQGSGVIYRNDGLMLATHHVVHGAQSLRVVLHDGREVGARVVGSDADTDIALLDLDGADFPTAPLGASSQVKVGQVAITIGSATDTAGGPVVRVGVVSALGREAGVLGQRFVDMIETDSAIAPGGSGAAVVDAEGTVIGIAAANMTTDAGVTGYATPIDAARHVAAQLLDDGRVHRGWLGIEGETLPAGRSKELGVAGGAVVRKVATASPAATVGLLPADIIVAIDDASVVSMGALVVRLRSSRPGDSVTLTVMRDGTTRTMLVALGEKPV